ncbi:MAG: hypothetical protein GY847_16705 [Proteobacteria bacterium]|nr:hypothetical protein [Pseudomonadota bacterium]
MAVQTRIELAERERPLSPDQTRTGSSAHPKPLNDKDDTEEDGFSELDESWFKQGERIEVSLIG